MFQVFIENEAGSDIKHSYNEKTLESITAEKVSGAYPFPYGFILSTTSGDGDNVDCFVITDKALKTGSVVECEAIGLINQIEDGEIDNKILGVLRGEYVMPSQEIIERIQYFAHHVFDHVPGKEIQVGKFMEREIAENYIQSCRDK